MNRRQALGCAAALALPSITVGRERRWARLPDLPAGLAGQFVGVHDGALIVAGGSYFSVPSWSGGQREWSAKAFLLSQPNGEWRDVSLPVSLAHGSAVSHRRRVLLIGGTDPGGYQRKCWWLRSIGREARLDAAPDLPTPLAYCGGALVGDTAYVFGGQTSPTATHAERALYSLDLARPSANWRVEREFPGTGRIYAAVASAGGRLFVAGGASLSAGPDGKPQRTYLRDAWSYHPGEGWRALPDLPGLTCAAPSIGVGDRFAILGGSDGSLDARVMELKDRHPGFPRAIRVYEPARNAWQSHGEVPFSLVATMAAAWRGRVVIPGGEDRPSHRSRAVWAVEIKEFNDARK
ncbi:MAG: hypothetical protein IT169_03445 [Bryobacterales bacterium]|nr:hypothetical protein [Bryobacterales bacterium]